MFVPEALDPESGVRWSMGSNFVGPSKPWFAEALPDVAGFPPL